MLFRSVFRSALVIVTSRHGPLDQNKALEEDDEGHENPEWKVGHHDYRHSTDTHAHTHGHTRAHVETLTPVSLSTNAPVKSKALVSVFTSLSTSLCAVFPVL